MSFDEINVDGCDATAAFEAALEEFLLDWYVEGAAIEDSWDITVPVTDAPNWTITIEKSYSEEAPSYRPSILDE